MGKVTFSGKKCLITGAASGIGKAVAVAAAKEGAILFLTDINDEALSKVCEYISRQGGSVAECRAIDISDYDSVSEFAAKIHREYESMDIVMNIAGISIWGEIQNLTHSQWRRTIEVNLMGPIQIMEKFIPPMISGGRGGNLVNVSSAAGLFGLPWHAAYSASKFGLRGVSEVLRYDLMKHNINVSLVCPGGVDSGLINTIEVAGIDSSNQVFVDARQRFRKRAVSCEKAARAILTGVRKNKYMVFTSWDVRVGYWFQRKFSWPYELVMRLMNREISHIYNKSVENKAF